uniref:ATP synthase F0 subunit 8 n=1 Tax=Saussurella borneensis TaxID=510017 RepID=A0A8F2F9Z0_9ORTH|nr:ATP synthase F0 subunit 8 [Saussurella borneensis]
MPQMSNLWWLPLMFVFISIFTISMSMNYTLVKMSLTKKSTKTHKTNMKWMW